MGQAPKKRAKRTAGRKTRRVEKYLCFMVTPIKSGGIAA
jgi:hypothetical protein